MPGRPSRARGRFVYLTYKTRARFTSTGRAGAAEIKIRSRITFPPHFRVGGNSQPSRYSDISFTLPNTFTAPAAASSPGRL